MIDWTNPNDDIWEAREIGRNDMRNENDELEDEVDFLNEEI